MGNSKKYEAIILDYFKNYVKTYKTSQNSVKPELVADKENQRYLLILIGWDDSRYIYAPLFHIDLIEGKIWLQHNGTDIQIADALTKSGIPKEDIVIGFKPVYTREYAGFGTG